MITAVYAVLLLSAMGLLIGILLSWASQRFAVDMDPRIEELEEMLPHINCGACGFPGCNGFATGLVGGKAEPDGCPPGGQSVAVKIAAFLGMPTPDPDQARPVIRIKCTGEGDDVVAFNYDYAGLNDCNAQYVLFGGNKGCQYGCIGLGSCVKVCPYDAFEWDDGRIPKVIDDKCTGCSLCIPACPVDLIEMFTEDTGTIVLCNSLDIGKTTTSVCKVGCVDCDKCVKVCAYEAIWIENHLAEIDNDKCTDCGLCVDVCPTNCIIEKPRNKVAEINEDCTGCLVCLKACPVDAIHGALKELHTVDEEACIGCGMCVDTCPPKIDAIDMIRPTDPAKVQLVQIEPLHFWDSQNAPAKAEPAAA